MMAIEGAFIRETGRPTHQTTNDTSLVRRCDRRVPKIRQAPKDRLDNVTGAEPVTGARAIDPVDPVAVPMTVDALPDRPTISR